VIAAIGAIGLIMLGIRKVPPTVIGGNGHSGTRIFLEIMNHAGVSCGLPAICRRRNSEDLRVFDLLNRWVKPYVYGELDREGQREMVDAFRRRLRLLFPIRSRPWAFKNPRSMLVLPILHEAFPDMRFVHVVRDGRDIALGNPFVANNQYVDAYLRVDERGLSPEEKMILFWGRSNEKAMKYGAQRMGASYLLMRWEELCRRPQAMATEVIRFSNGDVRRATSAATLINVPSSIGRWSTFPAELRAQVVARGQPWLKLFGYV